MAFIKRIIKDRNVVGGQRYTMTTLGDGRVEIVPSPDSVIEAGTQINSDLLQRYENFLEELQNHLNNTSNPHSTTKAQVGLGNVPNVDATNASNIGSGTLDKARLPADIPQANIVGLVAALSTLTSHIANTSNPHSVTKSQVGLGNVKNIDTTEASNITSGKLPVAQVPTGIPQVNISGLVTALNGFTSHINNASNPHGVTKAQVGLGNVPDVDTTNASNITSGILPIGRVPAAVTNHINSTSNPHGVTKEQVGLGDVMNFPVATNEQAQTGTINLAYMTPSRTTRLLNYAALISGTDFNNVGNIVVQPSMINKMIMVDPNVTVNEKTITVNTDLNTLSVGSQIHFLRYGTAEARFIAASGVTLLSDGNKRRIAGRYQMVTLLKIGANTWLLVGALKV